MASNRVGLIVLGLGVAAVIGTIFLALHVRGQQGGAADKQPTAEAMAEQEKQDMAQSLQSMKSAPAAETPKDFELDPGVSTDRQKKIKEKEIVGLWQARVDGGKAVLQIENGIYRVIVSFENKNLERRYSNGVYKMVGDLLILTPRTDWGPPQDKSRPEDTSNYRTLTVSDFPVLVSRQKNKLVWMNAKNAEGVPADVYIPNINPFLSMTRSGVAVWEPLE